ncbi:MAG: CvpA family protein [Proteobacteria bacterium]|nr:CvpA family protein [Pseudomonadota bacterium]
MEALDNLPVNPLDVAVLILLLISAVFAYARGFVHEVLSVGGWIGAIFATFYAFPYVRPISRKYISLEIIADLSAGVVVFVTTLVILSVLTRMISRKVQDSALNVLDRSLGFLFGLARGAVLICVLYAGAILLVPKDDQPKWVNEARAMQLIVPGTKYLRSLVPDHMTASAKQPAGGKAKAGATDKSGGTGKAPGFKELTVPLPKSAPAPAREGYDAGQRKNLERLIDGSSNQ